ncbi:PadR family transcriptional regulator [Oceanobacillus jeddahense]|uniref:PadR family transcriptional regulator n=1 Tax=Oceanobacillus jeddahense TaxID=1462527 RepID=A0ABY5JX94_9BACI|nr:PadR family transcriptional regulator [Oceanobacillus jeddahense]UUI04414.1 PadR family transcriptional regulator [Oceanobacillus jeddahense]
MKKYNDTTYAILGILTTNCRSGYEIKQFIDNSLNHFWKISYGQIYPTLKKLEQEELATIQAASREGKPDRKEYFLTEKGKEVLKDWLEQPLKQLPIERNEVLLKLFFGRHQTEEQSLFLLEDYKQKLENLYQTYEGIEEGIARYNNNHSDAKYWLFTLDYGKRVTGAAIAWCDETIKEL